MLREGEIRFRGERQKDRRHIKLSQAMKRKYNEQEQIYKLRKFKRQIVNGGTKIIKQSLINDMKKFSTECGQQMTNNK